MKNILITIAVFCTVGVVVSHAQSGTQGQPVPASRDAVIAPASVVNPSDTGGVKIDSRRDVNPNPATSGEIPSGDSGQPATSVRKPD